MKQMVPRARIPYALRFFRLFLLGAVLTASASLTGCAPGNGFMTDSGDIKALVEQAFADSDMLGDVAPAETITEDTFLTKFSMENQGIVEYQVPEMYPHIYVDPKGYSIGTESIAYVVGEVLPETFELVDAETKETVFAGKVIVDPDYSSPSVDLEIPQETTKQSQESGLQYVGKLDFSEWDEVGNYCISTAIYGYSYPFEIRKDTYQQQLMKKLDAISESCSAGETKTLSMLELLSLCEWEKKIWKGDDTMEQIDHSKEIRSLTKEWIGHHDFGGNTPQENDECVTLLAKYSYLFRDTDADFSMECLKKAASIYEQNKEHTDHKSKGKSGADFWALAELYRASGNVSYNDRLAEYMDILIRDEHVLAEAHFAYGAITYMETKYQVDLDFCSLLMKALLAEGELAGREAGKGNPAELVPGEELFARTRALLCANYVLQGFMYDRMLMDLLHYMQGQNSKTYDYFIEENQEGLGILLDGWMCQLEQQEFRPEFYY